MKYISKSLGDTRRLADEFLNPLRPREKATVVALEGDLGTGKTTFTQAVGELIGVEDRMQSPTFIIEKIYKIDWRGFENLIHIDAYRIEEEKELLHLGWAELVAEKENLIFIEWPENVLGILPKDAKKINFKFIDENSREIEY